MPKIGAAALLRLSAGTSTAVSPPSASAGTVDVPVPSAAGTTAVVSADRFTYLTLPTSAQPRSRVVPNLEGKSLKADRKRLKKAGCELGKVRGEKSKTAKVKKQSAKPGTILAPGSKVSVKLGG